MEFFVLLLSVSNLLETKSEGGGGGAVHGEDVRTSEGRPREGDCSKERKEKNSSLVPVTESSKSLFSTMPRGSFERGTKVVIRSKRMELRQGFEPWSASAGAGYNE